MIETHSGLDLALSSREESVSRVGEFVTGMRRLNFSMMPKLQPAVEEELAKSDFAIYFVAHRKAHAAPQLDARNMRHIGWQVTDLRGHNAMILFYGDACTRMTAETAGDLWVAKKPRLLPLKASTRGAGEDGGVVASSSTGNARRTFVITRSEQLMKIGKVAGFSFCIARDRFNKMCGNAVDVQQFGRNHLPQGGAFCQYHQGQKMREERVQAAHRKTMEADGIFFATECRHEKPPEAKKADSVTTTAANETQIAADTASAKSADDASKADESTAPKESAAARREKRHQLRGNGDLSLLAKRRLVPTTSATTTADSADGSSDFGEEGSELLDWPGEGQADNHRACRKLKAAAQRALAEDKSTDEENGESRWKDVTDCLKEMKGRDMNKEECVAAQKALGDTLSKARLRSPCEETSALLFVLLRKWRRSTA